MTPPARSRSMFAVVVLVSGLVLIDFCDLLFGCGCRSLWAGAAAGCNIHHAAGPHCPWCAHPIAGGTVAFAAVILAQTWSIFRCPGLAPGARLLLAFAALPLVGGAVGLLQGWWFGYWG